MTWVKITEDNPIPTEMIVDLWVVNTKHRYPPHRFPDMILSADGRWFGRCRMMNGDTPTHYMIVQGPDYDAKEENLLNAAKAALVELDNIKDLVDRKVVAKLRNAVKQIDKAKVR